MKDLREIYQALADGKTLKCKGFDNKITIENAGEWNISRPEDWSIYDMWEMQPAGWFISNFGEVMKSNNNDVTDAQLFGMKFFTKELAERARDEMKEANLIRYWASVIEPNWIADWGNAEQEKWFIDYNNVTSKYEVNWTIYRKTVGVTYMSKAAVNCICEALDSGKLKYYEH